ncbi:MAG: hypothetical protein IKY98_00545 [Alphaproteobacteria bacterium]|nr:hypothetical protein [Alphaproteobacteria bacterium]
MQAVLKMIRFLCQLAWRSAIVYAVFMIMAWILIGMHPKDTWYKTSDRVRGVWHWVIGFSADVKDAGQGLHRLGEKHLNEAQDRFHGIDPYEDVNRRLSEQAGQ